MREDDQTYFRRRAAEEHTAAERAEHPLVRDLHLELARHYESFASAGTKPESQSEEGGDSLTIIEAVNASRV